MIDGMHLIAAVLVMVFGGSIAALSLFFSYKSDNDDAKFGYGFITFAALIGALVVVSHILGLKF